MRKYFVCLDELWANREPHETEVAMFKAPSYLVNLFGLSRIEAMEATYAWMMTFAPDKSLDERVALAEAARPHSVAGEVAS